MPQSFVSVWRSTDRPSGSVPTTSIARTVPARAAAPGKAATRARWSGRAQCAHLVPEGLAGRVDRDAVGVAGLADLLAPRAQAGARRARGRAVMRGARLAQLRTCIDGLLAQRSDRGREGVLRCREARLELRAGVGDLGRGGGKALRGVPVGDLGAQARGVRVAALEAARARVGARGGRRDE